MMIEGLYEVIRYPDSKPIYHFLDGSAFRGCRATSKYTYSILDHMGQGFYKIAIMSEDCYMDKIYNPVDMTKLLGVKCGS